MVGVITQEQKNFYLSDDFMITARPWRWDQCWSQNKVIRRLMKETQDINSPKIRHFVGPRGCGKTSVARVLEMVASCCCIDQLINEGKPLIPCGQCEGCLGVHTRSGVNDGSIELDGNSPNILSHIDNAISTAWYRKNTGSNQLRHLIVIDEAGYMPECAYRNLHKATEDYRTIQIILITRNVEQKRLPEPLLDRMRNATYRFALPTVSEAAQGLMSVSQIVEIDLTADAAKLIAEKNNGSPRGCLSVLNQLRSYKGTTDPEALKKLEIDINDE